MLKRWLFDIEIERVTDPTLAHIFWENQYEIDRQLTALRDLKSPTFLYSSLPLYGGPKDSLVELARDSLKLTAAPKTKKTYENHAVAVGEIVNRAHEEIVDYHTQMSEFTASVELCDHIASGIMVSHDRLLVSEAATTPKKRVHSLLHHEVGTHLLTYFNGRCQPFR